MLGQFAEEVWIRAAQNTERLRSWLPNPHMAMPEVGKNGHLFRKQKTEGLNWTTNVYQITDLNVSVYI